MKIYELKDKGLDSKGYPYASGYGPLEGEMPFLIDKVREVNLEYWKVNPMKPGLYIDEKGTKWGDIIAVYFSPPAWVISERVLTQLQTMKGKIETTVEFPVAEIKAKKLRAIPPPRYFTIQLSGGIEADWRAMGVKLDELGRPILDSGKVLRHIAKRSSWNGDDIFCWSNWDPARTSILCTERLVDLAEKEKWTNVRFDPVATS